MTLLTKQQVCKILGIGYSTLGRWMREGKIKSLPRSPDAGKFEPTFFTVESLTAQGFIKPAPEPTARLSTPHYVKVLPYQDEPEPTFAEKYRAGEATDSFGNDAFSPNPVSLLGPNPPVQRAPEPGLFDHMNPAHLGQRKIGVDGHPIFDAASDNHPLNAEDIRVGRMQPTKHPMSRHPNQTRQEMLDVILNDVRKGYSR